MAKAIGDALYFLFTIFRVGPKTRQKQKPVVLFQSKEPRVGVVWQKWEEGARLMAPSGRDSRAEINAGNERGSPIQG